MFKRSYCLQPDAQILRNTEHTRWHSAVLLIGASFLWNMHIKNNVQFPRCTRNTATLFPYQDCSFSLAFALINCLCCWICFCKKLNGSSWASSSAPWSSSSFVLNSGSDSPVFCPGQGGVTDDFLMGGIGALLLRAAWLANAASWACWEAEGRPEILWLLQYAAAFAFFCRV